MKATKTVEKRGMVKGPAQRPPRALTVRQERFCEFIASGSSGTEAYLNAGFKCTRATARTNAAETLAKTRIKARIAELRKPVTKKLLLTKDRQREVLKDIVEEIGSGYMVKIRAIEVDAKLAGFFAPDRVEIDPGPKTLDDIRARAREMVSAFDLRSQMLSQAQPAISGNGSNGHNGNGSVHPTNGNGNGHAGALSRWPQHNSEPPAIPIASQ
jgi:hypothetical protein